MEKLIELLNEYDSGWDYDDYYGPYQYGQDRDAYIYGKYYLVSRDYGFIQWLVENDKIDRYEIIINSDFMPIAFDRKGEKYEWSEEKQLLMLLSIQDEPIEFLISILK